MATEHFDLPVPDPTPENAEPLDEAILKIKAALEAIDGIMHSQAGAIAGKAATSHAHEISDITGLATALAGKMDASATFSLDDLNDTSGTADAALGYLLGWSGSAWTPLSPAAALGSHGHSITEVAGLEHELEALGTAIAARLKLDGSNVSTYAAQLRQALGLAYNDATARAALQAAIGLDPEDLYWLAKPIGEPFPLMTDKTGVTVPPKDSGLYRFVLLTAGEDGSGEYNEGVLTSESVSGSAPLVVATAVINLDGSPMDGQTISLINTERRFLRAGSAGTTQDDAMQRITGTLTRGVNGSAFADGTGAFDKTGTAQEYYAGAGGGSTPEAVSFDSGNSPGARVSDEETRVKNIGVTYYMRIK